MSKSIANLNMLPEIQFQVVVADRDHEGMVLHYDAQARPMRYTAHWHHEWEVNLVRRGWAEYLVQGRRVRLSLDALTWLLPQHRHVLLDRSPDLLMWIGVFRPRLVRSLAEGITGEEGAALHRWLGGRAPDRPPHRLVGESVTAALHPLFSRLIDPDLTPPHRNAGLAWLLAECWDAYRSAKDLPAGSHLHPAAQRTVHTLHEHPDLDDLDALARDAGVSRTHLSRLFRQQVGCSLVDFRNRQRVRLFTELAGRGGRYTLTEAAYAAGFGSYTQCYRAVRSVTGKGPKELIGAD